MLQGCAKALGISALALVLATCAFLSGFAYSSVLRPGTGAAPIIALPVPGSAPVASAPPEFGVFWEAWNVIRTSFYGKIPNVKPMSYAAIRGVLKTLGDQHTVFLEPRNTAAEAEQLRGDFQGIGAYINLDKDQFVITAPIPGSPAEKAGILAGDIILKVGDKDVKGLTLDELVALIRGPRGSKVSLTIFRTTKPDPVVIEVARDIINLPSVISKMQDDNIGYVRLTIFGEKSKTEVADAINTLKRQGAKALVFDLRGNPGGYLTTAIDVAGQFIKDGPVAYERGKDGNEREFRATGNGAWMDGPLVVLIDKGSASASEIVSGAIQDRKRAILLGDTSFGKGSVQAVHQLSDKSSVHITIAEWLTPNKRQISGTGLTPDMSIPMSADDVKRGVDTQLEAALKYLKENK
ncbi:MAG: S41 family peptidase [Chloroflexi bacterium]|nr:S41 family peptidase [Chloroflexota bacterium]